MLVAGGGGGCSIYNAVKCSGGNGGGLSGSDGQGNQVAFAGKRGKQSQYQNSGYWNEYRAEDGIEGKGGDGRAPYAATGGGGGGGYFGGGGGSDVGSGGGGSSFISNEAIRKFTPDDMNTLGREGDGFATISAIDLYCTCKYQHRIPFLSLFMIITIK